MKRNRFTEERIIRVLREQEAGASVAELCRKHGMSSATFYAWTYNESWLIERHGHRSPAQFRRDQMDAMPLAA